MTAFLVALSPITSEYDRNNNLWRLLFRLGRLVSKWSHSSGGGDDVRRSGMCCNRHISVCSLNREGRTCGGCDAAEIGFLD